MSQLCHKTLSSFVPINFKVYNGTTSFIHTMESMIEWYARTQKRYFSRILLDFWNWKNLVRIDEVCSNSMSQLIQTKSDKFIRPN